MLAQEKTPSLSSRRRSSPSIIATSTLNATSALNSAAAGYVAGFTGVIFGHPLDSAKVWLQTNTTGKNKHWACASVVAPTTTTNSPHMGNSLQRPTPSAPLGTASMSTLSREYVPTSKILRSANSVRALYSGVTGPLISVGIVQSINFATYDAMRRILHRMDHPNSSDRDYLKNDSLANVSIAGFVAGTSLAFITSPLIRIKTKQQITGNGFRQAVRETLFQNGRLSLSGCFVGIYPHLISETVGRALYYAVYEASKRFITNKKEQQGQQLALQDRMVSAAFAGIVCWAVIFPFDSLRSRMYNQEGRLSTIEMARVMHGEKAFYRGFWLTVLRAGPVAAAVLPAYDLVLEKLSS